MNFLGDLVDISWTKEACPVHEMGNEVSGFIDKFEDLWKDSDVLSSNQLVRSGLIEESHHSSFGDNSPCYRGISLFLSLLGYHDITSDNFGFAYL